MKRLQLCICMRKESSASSLCLYKYFQTYLLEFNIYEKGLTQVSTWLIKIKIKMKAFKTVRIENKISKSIVWPTFDASCCMVGLFL